MRLLRYLKRTTTPALASLTALTVTGAAIAAPLNVGDSGSVGNRFEYNFNSALIAAGGQVVGYSFTAFEDATIDSISHRILVGGMQPGGEDILVQLHADNAGQPGTVLGSRTYAGSSSLVVEDNPLSNSVNLTAGQTYYVTVQTATPGGTAAPRLYGHSEQNAARPFDMREDPSLRMFRSTTPAATPAFVARNPYFYVTNGAAAVSGVGMPVSSTTANATSRSRSNGDVLFGQRFQITEAELGSGLFFEAESITLGLDVSGTPASEFFVRIRADDGTILASGSVDTSTASMNTGGTRPFGNDPTTIIFDNSVLLEQGIDYLITTDFNGAVSPGPGGASDGIEISYTVSGEGVSPLDEASNYLGLNGTMIRSNSTNDFMSGIVALDEFDLNFSLNGTVVPEPASVALLGVGLMMIASRGSRRD